MKVSNDRLKYIVCGLIVGVAFLIMLPGVVTYVFGIGRMALLIIIVIAGAWLLSQVLARATAAKRTAASTAKEQSEPPNGKDRTTSESTQNS